MKYLNIAQKKHRRRVVKFENCQSFCWNRWNIHGKVLQIVSEWQPFIIQVCNNFFLPRNSTTIELYMWHDVQITGAFTIHFFSSCSYTTHWTLWSVCVCVFTFLWCTIWSSSTNLHNATKWADLWTLLVSEWYESFNNGPQNFVAETRFIPLYSSIKWSAC